MSAVLYLALLQVSLTAHTEKSVGSAPSDLLGEAVEEYRAGLDCKVREQRLEHFRRAELLFARIIDGESSKPSSSNGGIQNADIFVNLGNAAMGAERLGPAILAYRRALALDPDHHRARQNLDYARTLLPDWVPKPERSSFLDTFFAWGRNWTAEETKVFAAIAFLFVAILVAASIRWRQTMLRNLAIMPALLWLSLLGLMLLKSSDNAANGAVVIVPEVTARSADSTGAPPRLPQPLPSGTEVQVIEKRDRWIRVRLVDSRDAWLPDSALEFVQSPSL